MGSKKGDRKNNYGGKKPRRKIGDTGYDDGGNWKKPKRQRKPRNNRDAIQQSIDNAEDWD